MSWEAGVCDYSSLPRPGSTEYWDDVAKATFSYDPIKKILNSYESVRSAKEKGFPVIFNIIVDYVWKHGLKGIIVWESSGDSREENKSILKVLGDGLKGA